MNSLEREFAPSTSSPKFSLQLFCTLATSFGIKVLFEICKKVTPFVKLLKFKGTIFFILI